MGGSGWFRLALAAATLLGFAATSAVAADTGHSGPSEVTFLVQILLLLTTGRALGEAMQRVGQPAVMGQLIAKVLLGPSAFGALWPEADTFIFLPTEIRRP